MKHFPHLRLAAILMALAATSGCRKEMDASDPLTSRDLPQELRQNNLLQLPGAVYRYAADSPIHWQPWTPEAVEQAKESNRMIFAVVAMAQAPGFAETLDTLDGDQNLVDTINAFYLPILIDGDAVREIGLLTADLSAEINQNVNLPVFIWMSPNADPVAWIPAPWIDAETTRDQFRRSHGLVADIWQESPSYVNKNSAMDNESRRERIAGRRLRNFESENPAVDTVRAIRQLSALYDPLSRNYDEIGGLFPSGALDLLASAAMQPELPADARRRAEETTRDVIKDLLGSAMFDPLDGGLFSARRGISWSLPTFNRHSISQSRAAVALFRMHQATGDALALERALGVLKFNESHYQTSEDLFAIGYDPSVDPQMWMWNIEEVEEILGEQEGQWWAELTNMRGLGNIPYEIDPERRFFRSNTLSLKQSLVDLAAAEGVSIEEFSRRFVTARDKLLAARVARLGKAPHDESSHAVASFRMVSAYAAAFTATGDDVWRDKAVALLGRSREGFSDGVKLQSFSRPAPPSIGEARAFVYAIAIQAILDVTDITSDTTWIDWCDDLATVMTENFTWDGFLREASQNATIIDLPMTDLIMLFDDSSVGLLNFAECRLAARERPLLRELREISGTLPLSAVDFPIQHTDLIQSFLSRHYSATVVYGPETSRELMDRIETLPLRMFHRRPPVSGENLPPGGCLVIRGSASPVTVMNPADLENALLPNEGGR